MVFYFSGTGNSLYVAKQLASRFDTSLISIAQEVLNENFNFTLTENEPILFVFPIYSWAPPKKVLDFIRRLNLNNYNANPISAIITCGENIGASMELLSKIFKQKQFNNEKNQSDGHLNNGFTVAMPSNYMIMGDIETLEIQQKMLSKVDARIEVIAQQIKAGADNHFDVTRGAVPTLLTHVIGSLFNKFAMDPKPFRVKATCTNCGICVRVCTTQTIKIVDALPVWGNDCNQCLACINYCPVRAIEYGEKTVDKGRYRNPFIKVNEMYLTREERL